jgi:hypothetical protein
MHRFLYLARRRADIDQATFLQRWQAHERLAAHCPDVLAEVRGYRQWQVTAGPDDGVVGVAETRCADAAAVYRMLECPGTREVLQPDELRFLEVPCRQSGLVADETLLEQATPPGDHACLWLMPRTLAGGRTLVHEAGRTAVERRLARLHEHGRRTLGDEPVHLSAGRCDHRDACAPFAALLLARLASAAAARSLAACWQDALQPGENVWCLQRAVRA